MRRGGLSAAVRARVAVVALVALAPLPAAAHAVRVAVAVEAVVDGSSARLPRVHGLIAEVLRQQDDVTVVALDPAQAVRALELGRTEPPPGPVTTIDADLIVRARIELRRVALDASPLLGVGDIVVVEGMASFEVVTVDSGLVVASFEVSKQNRDYSVAGARERVLPALVTAAVPRLRSEVASASNFPPIVVEVVTSSRADHKARAAFVEGVRRIPGTRLGREFVAPGLMKVDVRTELSAAALAAQMARVPRVLIRGHSARRITAELRSAAQIELVPVAFAVTGTSPASPLGESIPVQIAATMAATGFFTLRAPSAAPGMARVPGRAAVIGRIAATKRAVQIVVGVARSDHDPALVTAERTCGRGDLPACVRALAESMAHEALAFAQASPASWGLSAQAPAAGAGPVEVLGVKNERLHGPGEQGLGAVVLRNDSSAPTRIAIRACLAACSAPAETVFPILMPGETRDVAFRVQVSDGDWSALSLFPVAALRLEIESAAGEEVHVLHHVVAAQIDGPK